MGVLNRDGLISAARQQATTEIEVRGLGRVRVRVPSGKEWFDLLGWIGEHKRSPDLFRGYARIVTLCVVDDADNVLFPTEEDVLASMAVRAIKDLGEAVTDVVFGARAFGNAEGNSGGVPGEGAPSDSQPISDVPTSTGSSPS